MELQRQLQGDAMDRRQERIHLIGQVLRIAAILWGIPIDRVGEAETHVRAVIGGST